MEQNFENGAKFSKRCTKKIRGARHMHVKCASNARKVRVNLVPESARHLQMTRTRQMRVICAASVRESGVRRLGQKTKFFRFFFKAFLIKIIGAHKDVLIYRGRL